MRSIRKIKSHARARLSTTPSRLVNAASGGKLAPSPTVLTFVLTVAGSVAMTIGLVVVLRWM